jgi:hypothetical protein
MKTYDVTTLLKPVYEYISQFSPIKWVFVFWYEPRDKYIMCDISLSRAVTPVGINSIETQFANCIFRYHHRTIEFDVRIPINDITAARLNAHYNWAVLAGESKLELVTTFESTL